MQGENWTDVVTRLNRLTRQGKLEWEACSPPKSLVSGTDDKIDTVFFTRYRQRWVGIYLRKHQQFDPDTESYYWDNDIVIGVFNGHERDAILLWDFPNVGAAKADLYESIRYQAVDADNLLKEFLSDDEEK